MSIFDDAIPADGDRIPPRGWILAEVQGKEGHIWIDPAKVKQSRQPDITRLTQAQKKRIKAFKSRLGALDPASVTKTLENFSMDSHPDTEIDIWEAIADVVDAERTARASPSEAEMKLVYTAVLGCSTTSGGATPVTVDNLLSTRPQLKGLSGLHRIVDAYIERMRG